MILLPKAFLSLAYLWHISIYLQHSAVLITLLWHAFIIYTHIYSSVVSKLLESRDWTFIYESQSCPFLVAIRRLNRHFYLLIEIYYTFLFYLLICQILIECLSCARHCSRLWGYSSKQNSPLNSWSFHSSRGKQTIYK